MKTITISGKNWQVQRILELMENKYYGWKLTDVIEDLQKGKLNKQKDIDNDL